MTNIQFIDSQNIFESKCQTLVCPVNCVGAMGKGLALAMKNRFPDMVWSYKDFCNQGARPGNLLLWCPNEEPWVLCFYSKDHWKYPSKEEWIISGLKAFIAPVREWNKDSRKVEETGQLWYQSVGIKSIAFPQVGCGLGGLKWDKVKPLMAEYLSNLPDLEHVEIYENNNT